MTLLSLVPAVSYGTAWVEKHRSIKAFLQENEAVIAQALRSMRVLRFSTDFLFICAVRLLWTRKRNFSCRSCRGLSVVIVFTSDKRYNHNTELFAPYLTAAKYGKVLLSNFAAKGSRHEQVSGIPAMRRAFGSGCAAVLCAGMGSR